jgi:hypothetical protein
MISMSKTYTPELGPEVLIQEATMETRFSY